MTASTHPTSREVLIVESNARCLEAMTEQLEHGGLSVVARTSPIGATQLAVEMGLRVLVTGLKRAALQGSTLPDFVHHHPLLRHVRVLVVAKWSDERLLDLAEPCSADGLITEERIASDLVPAVLRLLEM